MLLSAGGAFWTGAGWALRRGFPPDSGREPGFLRRKPEERAPGALPPGPPFLWPARSHSLVLAWWGAAGRLWGYYEAHVRALIWKLSFAKMLSSIFSLENASQIGLGIPEETAPLSYQRQRSPKRANGSERAMNPGVQGRSPGPRSPHFSGEMGTPAGQAGPPGRCAPRAASELPTRRVRTSPPPPHTGAWLTRAATARAARTPEAPAWASPRVIPAPSPAAKKLGRAVSRSGESFSRAE